MAEIPIVSTETIKELGVLIKTDFGGDIVKRGVFHILCDIHGVWYDCRVGCLICYQGELKNVC